MKVHALHVRPANRGDLELDVAVVAGESQVGVERLDGFDAEAGLHPRLVTKHDPAVTRLGHLADPLTPGVQAHQGDADGGLVAR